MKTRGYCFIFVAMILVSSSQLYAYSNWTGGGGDFLWSNINNWDTNGAPGAVNGTVTIGSTSVDRTIYLDGGVSSFTALNLLQSIPSVSNILHVTKGGTVNVSNSTITLGNGTDSTAIAKIYLDSSLNQTTGAGNSTYLNINSGAGTLTIQTGGVVELTSYYNYDTAYHIYNNGITGNVYLTGDGKITSDTKLGNTPASGSGNSNVASTVINGSFTMDGGTLEIMANPLNDTFITGNRFTVNGDFSATGGTITFNKATAALFLSGVNNSIGSGVSMTSTTGQIMLGKGDSSNPGTSDGSQNFSSGIYIYTLYLRSYGNWTKTISSSASGLQYGSLRVIQSNAGYSTTIKLGSNITARVLAPDYALGSTASVGYVFDLNGKTLKLTDGTTAQSFSPTNLTNGSYTTYGNWYFTSTSSTTSIMEASSFNLSSVAQANVGYGVGATVGTVNSGSSGEVILKATGTGANNLGGGGQINPTSKFWYTGTSSTLTSNRNIGKLEVGGGSISTLKIVTADLVAAGDVKVNTLATLDLGGKNLQVGTATTTAFLGGNGTIDATVSNSSITFVGNGGFAPNGGGLKFTHAENITSVTLANTSVSNFLLAGGVYDYVDLNGVNIVYDGTLNLEFDGAWEAYAGQTFYIFKNQGAGSSGTFDFITSNRASYTFSFDDGTLTVTAIPEVPVNVMIGLGLLALCGVGILRKYQFQGSC